MSEYGVNDDYQNNPSVELSHIVKQPWFQDFEKKKNDKMNALAERNFRQEKEISGLKEQMGALRHFSDRNNDEMESYKLTSKWIDKLNEENDTHLKRYKILESQKNIVIHNMEGQIKMLNEKIISKDKKIAEQEKWQRHAATTDQKQQEFKRALSEKEKEIDILNAKLQKGDNGKYDEYIVRMQKMDKQIQQLMNTINQKDQEILKCQKHIDSILSTSSSDVSFAELKSAQKYESLLAVQLKQKTDILHKELKLRDEQIQQLSNEKKFVEDRLNIIENHKQTINNQNNSNTPELVMWQRKFNDIKQENESISYLKDNLQKEIDNVRNSDKLMYESVITEIKDRMNQQSQMITQLNNNIERLSSDLHSKESTNQKLFSQLEHLQNIQSNHRNREKEVEGLHTTIQVLKKENEYLYPSMTSQMYAQPLQNTTSENVQTILQNNQPVLYSNNQSLLEQPRYSYQR